MSLQDQSDESNLYLVVIPKNCTNDIHICGRCKVQYTLLSLFFKHKETCKDNEFKESSADEMVKKSDEMDNLMEIGLESFSETIEKDTNQTNLLNNLLDKDQNQLRQYKSEDFEEHDPNVNQKELSINPENSVVQENSQPCIDCKRTLQNDEEDIATLLANQLSSETDEIISEPPVDMQQVETLEDTHQSKENIEKDENKVMYRGKMRKLFSCQVQGCLYKTLLRKDIERHSRIHTGERPFKCFLCEKAFNRTDKLLLHQRIHAGDKRYKCTKCDYASVDSGSLIKHLRVHNGERPFKCQLCSYRARDSSQLTVHLRTHTGDSPFICMNSKCKAAFKTNSDLKRHMVVHSEEKPHSCMYCPYKSTLKRNLQIHIQSQHPNGELKEYKCHICPKFVLPTTRKLKNHMKKQHGLPEETVTYTNNIFEGQATGEEGSLVEKLETYKKRKSKTKRSNDKIAVGVMNKAYDCKLCDASFVCQDSLVTHQRYHSKIEDELRKTELNERSQDLLKTKYKKVEVDSEKKVKDFPGDLILNGGCVVDNSFNDSLRNAEILASLNSTQTPENRQFAMVAPEAMQNVYNSEDYVLVQN